MEHLLLRWSLLEPHTCQLNGFAEPLAIDSPRQYVVNVDKIYAVSVLTPALLIEALKKRALALSWRFEVQATGVTLQTPSVKVGYHSTNPSEYHAEAFLTAYLDALEH